MEDTMSEPANAAEMKKAGPKTSHASEVTRPGFFVKLVLMMLIDALGIYGMFTAYMVKSWAVLAVLAVLLVAVNWVYFSKRTIPAKYLVPGMVFLLIYQVFVMGYTGYVSFTNYGQGHNSTKEDAVASILKAAEKRAPGARNVPAAVLDGNSKMALAIVDPATGGIQVGD
ncbi:MAG: maltose ABC transporter permease, partial [Actinomyces sp.]|nr:maltose ABC transporter permease [Actinomyces sp.]